jgi:hypothetical protein
MRTSPSIVASVALAALLLAPTASVSASPLPGQQRSATKTDAASSGTTTVTASSNTTAGGTIEETDFRLKRADVDAKVKTLPGAPAADGSKKKSTFGSLTDSLKKSVNGDDRREEAAKLVVEDLAQQASANNTKTVVVVIGNADDRAKVKTSMGNVQRRVVLASIDKSVKDDTYDNSVLGAGLADHVTGAASNIWVFIPRTGQKAHKPDETFSTHALNEKIWTGIFATDGDLPVDANSVINRSSSGASASSAPSAPETKGTSGSAASASTPAATAAAAFAVGDIVRPKIASVKLMDKPSDSAKALATLTKTDELVVIGGDKDGFTNVQGGTAAGWVKTVMLSKP